MFGLFSRTVCLRKRIGDHVSRGGVQMDEAYIAVIPVFMTCRGESRRSRDMSEVCMSFVAELCKNMNGYTRALYVRTAQHRAAQLDPAGHLTLDDNTNQDILST